MIVMINEKTSKKELIEKLKVRGVLLESASERLKSDLIFLSLMVDEFGVRVLEKNNLKEIYEDLKLKEEMKKELDCSSKNKERVKKF